MGNFYDSTSNDKIVTDGNTAFAEDLNKVNRAAEAAFDLVEQELLDLSDLATLNNLLALAWATYTPGQLPPNPHGQPLNTTDYSAKANASESSSWASAAEDADVVGSNGIAKPGQRSALHWAAKASDSKDAALASEKAAQGAATAANGSATQAQGFASQAQASALSALGTNTVSASSGISVETTGAGPYNHAISHADTSSVASSGTLAGASIFSSLSFDTYGHVTGALYRDLSPGDIGASAVGHAHENYAPYNPLTFKLRGVGGTSGGWQCSSVDCGTLFCSSDAQFGSVAVTGSIYCDTHILLGTDRSIYFNNTPCLSYAGGNMILGLGASASGCLSSTLRGWNYASLQTGASGEKAVNLSYGNALYPTPDNTISLGVGSFRWAAVYAAVGTIQTSDERLKDFSGKVSSDWIYKLDPQEYVWKDDEHSITHFGFSAQKVEEAVGRENIGLVKAPFELHDGHEDLGNPYYSLNYSEFISPMVSCIQKQKVEIDELKARIQLLEDMVYGKFGE